MRHNIAPTFLNIAIITLTSLIASLILLAANRAYIELEALKKSPMIIVFLKDEVKESEALKFTSEVSEEKRIRSVKYVSKSEALLESQRKFSQYPSILSNLASSNPLPASVEISLKEESLKVPVIIEIANKLTERKEVEDIRYDSNVSSFMQNADLLGYTLGGALGISVGLIVLLSSGFWASFRKREGDFSRFKAFFVGAFTAALGSFFGIGFCYAIYYALSFEIDTGAFLSAWQIIYLSGITAILGAVGAFVGSFGRR